MPAFNHQVWKLCSRIPKGMVSTYKELAHALKCRAYQAVGNALNKNPYSPKVPCHRVVKSDGNIGGFAKGIKKKAEMLEKENVFVNDGKIKDFKKKLFRF